MSSFDANSSSNSVVQLAESESACYVLANHPLAQLQIGIAPLGTIPHQIWYPLPLYQLLLRERLPSQSAMYKQ